MSHDPDAGFDRFDFHEDVECGQARTEVHQAIRDALLDCGVAHACCATTFAIGHVGDEDGVQVEDTQLVVFYGHKHYRISPEQEFALVNAMAEAQVPVRKLGEDA